MTKYSLQIIKEISTRLITKEVDFSSFASYIYRLKNYYHDVSLATPIVRAHARTWV